MDKQGMGKVQLQLVLASHNHGKAREIREILAPLEIGLLCLADFPGVHEAEESGATFEENAVIKALSALDHTGLPSIADDSGLMVDFLGGAPGVHSARFAGDGADDRKNNILLLERLSGAGRGERHAVFVSVVAFAEPSGKIATFRGEAGGIILERPRGNGGFGYDPLFLSDDLGVTFAEATPEEKNRVSHRARALAELARHLAIRY